MPLFARKYKFNVFFTNGSVKELISLTWVALDASSVFFTF
jgi:hypothetical protein